MVKIGVLAIQGAFFKHQLSLSRLSVEPVLVRSPRDLETISGLILPGGESTVVMKGMDFTGLKEAITAFGKHHPIFGTCAGIILMSGQVLGDSMEPFGFLNLKIQRNAYGRQADSFYTQLKVSLPHSQSEPAYFIRAPKIVEVEPGVEVLSRFKGDPVLVKEGHFLGSTFHPELTDSLSLHKYFVDMVRQKTA